MKKSLGRIASAVLAGALITVAVAPAAMAQEERTPPTSTSSSSAPTSTATKTSEPTKTSSSQPEDPTEGPYIDDVAYVADLGEIELLMIACAAGEPKNVSSPKFDIVEGPIQNEEDGRFWIWESEPHAGVDLNDPNAEIPVNWTCGGKPGGGSTPLNPGGEKGKGGNQVKYKPKKGVETSFGLA